MSGSNGDLSTISGDCSVSEHGGNVDDSMSLASTATLATETSEVKLFVGGLPSNGKFCSAETLLVVVEHVSTLFLTIGLAQKLNKTLASDDALRLYALGTRVVQDLPAEVFEKLPLNRGRDFWINTYAEKSRLLRKAKEQQP